MKNSARYGFTFVELLVCMAMLALLVTLLIPTFTDIQEHTRATACKANLKECADGINSAPSRRPYPPNWRRFLVDRGVQGVLICPSDVDADKIREPDEVPDLAYVYLVQLQGDGTVLFSNIKKILDVGTSLEDDQVRRVESAFGQTAGPGRQLILIGSECAMMSLEHDTDKDETTISSIIIPTTHTGHNSIHWLCVDNYRSNWRNYVRSEISADKTNDGVFVMRLQSGHFYKHANTPVRFSNQRSSYAMSDAVDNISPRSGQLMLVEWTKEVARVLEQGYGVHDLGSSNMDPNGYLRTRHFDRANIALVDGSVESRTREDLQWQRDSYTPVKNEGIWAP